jgi:TRAP transporter TAXI family solute receptor
MFAARALGAFAMTAVAAPAILSALLSLIPAAQAQDVPRTLTLGTASPGGPYYAYGEGLARILSRTLKIETTAQVTQGPAQNIVLLEKKEAMLGFITTGAGLHGWNGTDWAKGTHYRSMRVIFPMFDTAFQFVSPKRRGIKSLDQFSGLRVGVGPRAGTGGTYVPEIFKALDIAAEIRHGAWEAIGTQLSDGSVDGMVATGGLPFPTLVELEKSLPIDFVQPSNEQIATIRKALPELSASTVAAGTYNSLKTDYPTVGLYNFAVAHRDLPDDLVYRIVKEVFANNAEMVRSQPSARETIPANIARNTLLPLHPGAARYYRESGIGIPVTPEVAN